MIPKTLRRPASRPGAVPAARALAPPASPRRILKRLADKPYHGLLERAEAERTRAGFSARGVLLLNAVEALKRAIDLNNRSRARAEAGERLLAVIERKDDNSVLMARAKQELDRPGIEAERRTEVRDGLDRFLRALSIEKWDLQQAAHDLRRLLESRK